MSATKVKENVISMTLTQNSVRKAVKSYTMSKRYINTMLRATVINILYHRLNIDEREFTTKEFNHISFKTFRSKSKNALIREFHSYMAACKDALEKNYLREFYLYFVDTNSGNIVENYKFTFRYSEKGQRIQTQNEEDLVESTAALLQTLEDFSKHNKFSSEIELRVEFTYLDDTPEDYEPPGFKSIEESNSLMKKLGKNNHIIILGSLFTGFHLLKCSAKGGAFNLDCSQSSNASNADNHIIQNNQTNGYLHKEQSNGELPLYTDPQIMTEDLSLSISQLLRNVPSNETYISQCVDISRDSDVDGSSTEVDCPCKLPENMDSWNPDVVQCIICNRRSHAPCQGYLDKSFLGPSFRCGECKESPRTVNSGSITRFPLTTNLGRVRYLVACLFNSSKLPSRIEEGFKETVMKFCGFQKDGNIATFSRTALDILFDFTFKEPDTFEGIVRAPVLPTNQW